MIYTQASFGEPNPAPATSFRSDVETSNPLYSVQNQTSQDIATVQRIAHEMIQRYALVNVHCRTDNADHDKVFDEDPDPTYWPPIPLKAFFVPKPLEYELTLWGVDAPNQTEIVFSMVDINDNFRERLLRSGDLIEIPYNSQSKQRPKYYKVDNAQEFGNFRYVWLYLKCQTTNIVGDPNIRPAYDQGAGPNNFTDETD